MGVKRWTSVFALLLATSCSSSPSPPPEGTNLAVKEGPDWAPGVKFIYSANISGEIDPCGCRSNPSGGLVRAWTFLSAELAATPASNQARQNALLLDSGDLFYASSPAPPFLAPQWNSQAHSLLAGLNKLGLDAYAPGEHDFASGFAEFESLRKKATFTFLSANLMRDGKPYLQPYAIFERGGRKIAVFALYDEELPLPQELKATSHIEAARALIPELRRKAQVVIALTHLGVEKDMALAKAVSGIDGIFGAHTQSYLQDPLKVDDTLIFQPSFRNQVMGVYSAGHNRLVPLDTSYEPTSPSDFASNPMTSLVADAKKKIADLNQKAGAELSRTNIADAELHPAQYQTFVKCADCHKPQYDFYKKTHHFKAYTTLVNKKQNLNKDCLSCHTLGMNEPSGWSSVDKLVFNATGKPVAATSFVQSLPQMPVTVLSRYSKAFVNVQCEHCHGPGNDHPFGAPYGRTVSSTTCLKCHTQDQAPAWYRQGKPDYTVIDAKKKSVACPRDQ